jgi:hypothetical protein
VRAGRHEIAGQDRVHLVLYARALLDQMRASKHQPGQAAIGISSDRQFLGLIGRVLPGWFPHLPDQSQYNRRLRALVELISIVQQGLARWLDSGDVRLSDGTLIGVANYPGCQRRSKFAGFARFGFAKSHHRFVYGVRLVLLTDARGRIRRRSLPGG